MRLATILAVLSAFVAGILGLAVRHEDELPRRLGAIRRETPGSNDTSPGQHPGEPAPDPAAAAAAAGRRIEHARSPIYEVFPGGWRNTDVKCGISKPAPASSWDEVNNDAKDFFNEPKTINPYIEPGPRHCKRIYCKKGTGFWWCNDHALEDRAERVKRNKKADSRYDAPFQNRDGKVLHAWSDFAVAIGIMQVNRTVPYLAWLASPRRGSDEHSQTAAPATEQTGPPEDQSTCLQLLSRRGAGTLIKSRDSRVPSKVTDSSLCPAQPPTAGAKSASERRPKCQRASGTAAREWPAPVQRGRSRRPRVDPWIPPLCIASDEP
ncbi:hypothetical protein Purlil1_5787 [Purpureocillium lilacinum]|uniref:Uncharacterized protein n=1 Tax=Purpureocillium lilacinum TaxID=33203 RepID=A0ABR0C011_PURLI|nr:hypothetical protein Purlil1_5787 [Purpureocillium lilacinum]